MRHLWWYALCHTANYVSPICCDWIVLRERAIKGEGERSTELEMKDGGVIDVECCRDNFHGLIFVPGGVRW